MTRVLGLAMVMLACCCHGADNIKVYFSPKGGCTAAITNALNAARSSVYVAAYSFTSAPIAKSLTDAKKRGVNVHVVLDNSNETDKYSSATFLRNYGVPVYIDGKHKIQHNKYMVIDGVYVITGSFNFSKSAEESNAENLLVIADRELAGKYFSDWKQHQGHCTVYTGPKSGKN